jgi:hypothetical protein
MRKHLEPYESTKYKDNIQLCAIKYRRKRTFYTERHKKKATTGNTVSTTGANEGLGGGENTKWKDHFVQYF